MSAVIVIPTYNEADGIETVLDAVLRAEPSAHVTAHTACPDRVTLLSRPYKDGLGAAYRAGFAWALDRDYDVVVQMDADLSHPPGGVSNWSLGRRLVSWAGNTYVRAVLNISVHDATAGFRAFRRQSLRRLGVLESQSNGYSFQAVLLVLVWRWRQVRTSVQQSVPRHTVSVAPVPTAHAPH